MNEESDLVARTIEKDINTLVEDLNIVIKAHNVLVEENQQLKDRIIKAIHRIQLLQMDGVVEIKDLGLIARDLKGDKE